MGQPFRTSDPSATRDGVGVPATFIVPLDGTDFSLRAVPIVRRYAEAFDADVIACTTPQTLDASERATVPAWLASLVAEATNRRFRASVVDGDDPALAVAELLVATPDSAVCMTTHARGPIGTAALGNVAQEVLRRVAAPALLVGRHCADDPPEHGPMVVAHDGSPSADAVLASARRWARACGFPIVLVHVYHPLDVPSANHPLDAVRSALEYLGPDTTVEVVASSFPAGVIRDLAHELDASAIALSTHGRTGAARVVMGSVASWVTRESSCPVLSIRPASLGSA